MLQQVISQQLQDKTNMIFMNSSHVPLCNYDNIVTSSLSTYNQSQQNTWPSQYQSTNYNNIATTIAISESATQQTIQNNFSSYRNNHDIYTKLNKIFKNSNISTPPKMFICQTCKKSFTSHSHLRRHSKTALHKNMSETFHQRVVSSVSFNNNSLLRPAPIKFSSNTVNSLGEISQLTINQHHQQQPQSIHGSLTNVVDSQIPTFQHIQSYSNPTVNTNSCITVAKSSNSNSEEQQQQKYYNQNLFGNTHYFRQ